MFQSLKAQKGYAPADEFIPLLLGVSLLSLAVSLGLKFDAEGGWLAAEGIRFYAGIVLSVLGMLSLLVFLILLVVNLEHETWMKRGVIDACEHHVREICASAGHPGSSFCKNFRGLRDSTTVSQLLGVHPEETRAHHLKSLETLLGSPVSASDRLDVLADRLRAKSKTNPSLSSTNSA